MKKSPEEIVETNRQDGEKRYFAFVSYTRSDLAAAQFVQRTLEHFRYPGESIRKEYHPDDAKYVREIFLDKTGLSGRGEEFERRLEAALANSRYLIVVCSPRAAQKKADPKDKHYVEWEIQTFLKHHGEGAKDRIIPVVLEGEPNRKSDSCLPEPLRTDNFVKRNLPDMRPQPSSGGKGGRRRSNWQSAIVTLLSYVFNVERSIIFDRFAAERAKTRARIAVSVMCGVLVAAALATWGIVERRHAADREAERHLVEAVGLMEKGKYELFPETGLALAHLAKADRLPSAHDYLKNQLLQRSWIVPVGRRKPTAVEVAAFQTKAAEVIAAFHATNTLDSIRIRTPKDFPLTYRCGGGQLTAYSRVSVAKDGIGQEAWHIGERDAGGFWSGFEGLVSQDGRTLVMLRMPRNGHPEYEIVTFNPFTGQRLWGRDVAHPVRFCCFSGDGNRLAVLSPLGTLRILNASTGEPEFEAYEAGGDVLDVSFSADDSGVSIMSARTVVECRFVKNVGEYSFKPTGYPIVAHRLSGDGKAITLEMNMGGRFGVADTYDTRTFERISRVDLTNVVVRTVRKAGEAASGDGRFRAKVADGREMKNAVRLLDSRSRSATGRLLQFPNEVKNLSFMELGGREYLLVLGGSQVSAMIKGTAFYSLVDPETGRMVRLRQGLPNELDVAWPLGGGAVLMSGQGNNECRLAMFPIADRKYDGAGFESLCALLGGVKLDDSDIPVEETVSIDNLAAGGIWSRFIDYAGTDATNRTVSFVSEIHFSRIVDVGSKDEEWREMVLSVVPGHPVAWAEGWIGDLERMYRKNYAYAHKEMPKREIDGYLDSADFREDFWEALSGDPQVRFYAAYIMNLMDKRHPSDEAVKKALASIVYHFNFERETK